MRQPHAITVFQKECAQKVKDLTKEIGKQIDFKEIVGRNETFYQCEIDNVDVYIYSDEAGFMLKNKKWIICEKSDYSKSDELIKDFLLRLKAQLINK